MGIKTIFSKIPRNVGSQMTVQTPNGPRTGTVVADLGKSGKYTGTVVKMDQNGQRADQQRNMGQGYYHVDIPGE